MTCPNCDGKALAFALERERALREALEELSAMYAQTWDMADGGLSMMGSGIPRFEAAHEKASAALALREGGK